MGSRLENKVRPGNGWENQKNKTKQNQKPSCG